MKKMQSVYGIYKKHGREAFLDAAEYYSDHVNHNSVEKTIDEMESRWYDSSHEQKENDGEICCDHKPQRLLRISKYR